MDPLVDTISNLAMAIADLRQELNDVSEKLDLLSNVSGYEFKPISVSKKHWMISEKQEI